MTQPPQGDITFRTLLDSEKDEWIRLCARVFVNAGEAYFRRHLEADPDAHLAGIQVAVHSTIGLIGSVRVFHRTCCVLTTEGPKYLRTGGIGEVCTLPEFRGQKIATRLLQQAITYMKDNNFQLSALMTGPAAPLYAQLGWKSVSRSYVQVPRPVVDTQAVPIDTLIQALESSEQVQSYIDQFQVLHSKFIASTGSGCFTRSQEYWHSWWLQEVLLERRLFVAFDSNDTSKVLAYLVTEKDAKVHQHDGSSYSTLDVHEFVGDFTYFKNLAQTALQTVPEATDGLFVYEYFANQAAYQIEQPKRTDIQGLMYLSLSDDAVVPTNDNYQHIFMRVDCY